MLGSVPNPPTGTAAAAPLRARCVLFNQPGAAVPSDLLNSLARRIGHITSCTDAYTAMAEVCSIERDRTGVAVGPTPAGAATVLLFIEPRALPDAAELISQLRLFAPNSACWKFEAAANPKLSAVVDTDVATWVVSEAAAVPVARARGGNVASNTPSPSAAPAASTPRLRIAGASLPDPSGPLPDAPEIVVRPQPRTARATAPPPSRTQTNTPPTLTLRGRNQAHDAASQPASAPLRPSLSAEELRMLLGDDPLDHGPTNGAAGGIP